MQYRDEIINIFHPEINNQSNDHGGIAVSRTAILNLPSTFKNI
jgi:hypothetical protein